MHSMCVHVGAGCGTADGGCGQRTNGQIMVRMTFRSFLETTEIISIDPQCLHNGSVALGLGRSSTEVSYNLSQVCLNNEATGNDHNFKGNMLHLPSNFSISNCVTPPRAPFSSPSRYMSPSHHLSSPHRRGFTPADAAREAIPGSPSRFIFNNMPQQPLSSHKKKKNKPPKKPKGYVSGFNFFASEARTRDDLKEEFRDLSNIDIHKAVGRMWHELPQQDKAAYLKLADEDKLRYLREVHEYNQLYGENLVPKVDPPSGFGLDGQPLSADFEHHFVNDDDLTKNEKSKKKRGRRVNPAKKGYLKNVTGLKRPLTSYSLFAHQEKDLLCGMKFQDLQRRMGKYLGLRWRNMDPEERRMYDLLAETGATTTDKQWLSA